MDAYMEKAKNDSRYPNKNSRFLDGVHGKTKSDSRK